MEARKKKVLTVLCIGSVILVWRGYGLITKIAPSVAEANPETKMVEPVPPVIHSAQVDEGMEGTWEQQRLAAELPWGRDPCAAQYRPANTMTDPTQVVARSTLPTAPTIKLSGVSRSGDQWLAAVDGNIVRVGDMIVGGFQVIEISQHAITLESAGWTFTYAMGAEAAVARSAPEEK